MISLTPILPLFVLPISLASPMLTQDPSHPTCTSTPNVKACVLSGLSLDSALHTFFCYSDSQLEEMDKPTKIANLATVIVPYLDISLEKLLEREDLVIIL